MKTLNTITLLLCFCLATNAADRTLRLDYIFSGNESSCSVSLSGMSSTQGWYGRRINMDSVPVKGNGRITMKDSGSGKVLYAQSFSTLFQEWQATPEAKIVSKAFENTFLVPMPDSPATIEIELYNTRGEVQGRFSHPVNPKDILIKGKSASTTPRRYIHQGGKPESCIDVVILAEGYTDYEAELFYNDAAATVEAILAHEPFRSMKDRFNFLAVAAPSRESGVSIPYKGVWKDSAVGSHFDTFYSRRYLTTTQIFKLHDLLDGLAYEHLIILANTDTYGGGGIYNSYTLTTAHHAAFKPVVVHEFGHSFGALADEYAYAGDEDPYYFPNIEPWEQNITTKADFPSKWEDMIRAATPGVGLFEGAGYQSKNVWRPAEDCRMRTNAAEDFCPVCVRAIKRMIEFNLGLQ